MNTATEIYALCHCASFDFSALKNHYLANQRWVAYRDELHVEWHQGEIFIFDLNP